ncbi:purine nucleoside permease [Colwellia sp. 6_MG-2023]|jgi:purine nucleoside permease|uniref:purine nucleoside permease n=1 Tax=Colwellia sp. 6_MG-2023 TaxID=3062676 RepID=UPI0026E22AD1|nr:purine nucleoside permease [Colwellia sp. 6_MG-2023]MDO6488823.1 purine nucleoside permease [Colwellia sp. 6_MG-2023]
MKYLLVPITLLGLMFTLSSCSAVKTATQNSATQTIEETKPIQVKVVVVNMFEIGEDSGDKAGEFQLWKEGQALNTKYEFPQGFHDLYLNEETGVLGMVTGMGTARATAAIMALGLDPRFDLTQAYWLVAGIAGVDPHDASIGSAVWATWLVDGDLAHQIDAREAPKDWATGYFPLFSHGPYKDETVSDTKHQPAGEVYKINGELAEWAYQLTKNTPLTDYPAMQKLRAKYVNYPKAQLPPFVLKGDHMAASTFWHGKLLNEWANSWTKFWSDDQANFVTSGMEDTGSYQALTYLDSAGKADKNRFMVLRTASNYSMPPDSLTAAENLAMESGEEGFAGMLSSLESAYSVGSIVVDNIVANWSVYKETPPYQTK